MNFTSARRDVGIVAVCMGVSYVGDFLAETALTLNLQGHGASSVAVAALLLASMVPIVALAPVAGRIADRYSSRTILILVGAAQVTICVALAYSSATWLVIALMAVLAAGVAVTGPTLQALVPQMVGADRLPRAQATIQTVRGLGPLAGPALAGVLVGTYGPRLPLLVDAASFGAIVAAGLLLATVRRGGALRADPATGRVRGGWSLIRQDRLLFGVMLLVLAGIAAVTCDNVGEVYLIRQTLHSTATMYGALGAVWSAAALAGAWLLGRNAHSDRRLVHVLVAALAIIALVMLGFAAAPSVPWLVPIYVVGGVANGAVNFVTGLLLARRVDPDARGRVGATISATANAGTILGFATGGLALTALSPRPMFAASGILALVVIATLTPLVLRAAHGSHVTDEDHHPAEHAPAGA